MSAADFNSPHQFKLFYTGSEWKNMVTHSTDGPMPQLWEEKEARARAPQVGGNIDMPDQASGGIYDSLHKHGYVGRKSLNDPIIKGHPSMVLEESPNGKDVRVVQSEGHHRVAAAAALEAEGKRTIYFPSNITDNTSAGRRARRGARPAV